MATFDRAELDEMITRWVDANKRAEAEGDWKPLADMYTEDATYGWNYGPTDEFMAVGREEIRDLALGQEMDGLEGWQYPYQQFVVDELGKLDAYWNIGPTVWWGGQVVGGWAVRSDGSVATRLLLDRGVDAERAVAESAEDLAGRLAGTVVVPSFRTPLERDLSA